MKTNHSSLLADTGLSEVELDRILPEPIKRLSYEPIDYNKEFANTNPAFLGSLLKTWYPYEDKNWYDDEDVKKLIGSKR